MKRYLIATLVLLALLPAGASAQWYLFPGGRPAKDSTSVKDMDLDFVPVRSEEEIAEEEASVWITHVSLILPFKSKDTPNGNFLDFYSGVLMAANELSSPERRFEISVYDSTVGLPTSAELESSDLIIGPVSFEDVSRVLPRARGKFIISPLDPKVASLTTRHNVIQAPSGWESQVDELVRWVKEDYRGGDSVVLLQSAEEASGEITTRMVSQLSAAGVRYEINSSPLPFEGRSIGGTCRFLIASENDSFCAGAVRDIALMNLRGGRNALYTTSRIRSIQDLEIESIHAANAHIAATYYADPKDASVLRFADSYRGTFKGDPGQWVYQGYDLMNYFGSTLGRDSAQWKEQLASTPGKGLQTDFSFDGTGKNNTAVRRLLYNPNNTITAIK